MSLRPAIIVLAATAFVVACSSVAPVPVPASETVAPRPRGGPPLESAPLLGEEVTNELFVDSPVLIVIDAGAEMNVLRTQIGAVFGDGDDKVDESDSTTADGDEDEDEDENSFDRFVGKLFDPSGEGFERGPNAKIVFVAHPFDREQPHVRFLHAAVDPASDDTQRLAELEKLQVAEDERKLDITLRFVLVDIGIEVDEIFIDPVLTEPMSENRRVAYYDSDDDGEGSLMVAERLGDLLVIDMRPFDGGVGGPTVADLEAAADAVAASAALHASGMPSLRPPPPDAVAYFTIAYDFLVDFFLLVSLAIDRDDEPDADGLSRLDGLVKADHALRGPSALAADEVTMLVTADVQTRLLRYHIYRWFSEDRQDLVDALTVPMVTAPSGARHASLELNGHLLGQFPESAALLGADDKELQALMMSGDRWMVAKVVTGFVSAPYLVAGTASLWLGFIKGLRTPLSAHGSILMREDGTPLFDAAVYSHDRDDAGTMAACIASQLDADCESLTIPDDDSKATFVRDAWSVEYGVEASSDVWRGVVATPGLAQTSTDRESVARLEPTLFRLCVDRGTGAMDELEKIQTARLSLGVRRDAMVLTLSLDMVDPARPKHQPGCP